MRTELSPHPPLGLPFHYGWVVVAAGMLSIFACLGFGRFAIGMLLPAMGTSLGLSYSQMGFISTFNFVGYLVSVLVIGYLTPRFGTRRVVFVALLLVGVSMILIGRATDYRMILLLYTLTGIGSGAANVPIMALIAVWFLPRSRGRAGGFVVIGSGFAILLSGKLVPYVNALGGTEGWRESWMVLGAIVIGVAAVTALVIRNCPEDVGLEPAGGVERSIADGATRPYAPQPRQPLTKKTVFHLGAVYFLFGCTYVIYATFIVTSLVTERGYSEAVAGTFWSWVGLLSLLSGPVFGTLSDRWGRRAGLMTVFSIQAVAYLLVGLALPGAFLYLSIGLFGVVAWSIPSIMAALVGDLAGPQTAARIFGIVTFIFALGQITGPAVAGVLAETAGTFSSSFLMAAALAGTAVLLSRLLPDTARS